MSGQTASQEAAAEPQAACDLLEALTARSATVGIIGMGYVGLPLAMSALRAGFRVIGFDIDADRVARLNDGRRVIGHIDGAGFAEAAAGGRFEATADFSRLDEADAILICVPTPLTRHRDPDLSYVEATAQSIAARLRPGQLVVLESTTYPGTTDEVLKPILEAGGLRSGHDFFLAYSPEREDPGNSDFNTASIPKVVGGDGRHALALADTLYAALVTRTVPVGSTATAEAVKLTENIFRAVNIALVNELKVVYDTMDIDVWEVIDAAKTKPFGFMPFYPGPGLGGHCIPIDPFYLTWKAREYGISTRFVELSGEINTAMPQRVVDQCARALDRRFGRGLNGARVLVLGIAYKKNIEDIRESPALRLIELLEERGAETIYHDPHVAEIPVTREHAPLAGRRSAALSREGIGGVDLVLIATDHDDVDYALIVDAARLVVDTRNACARRDLTRDNVVKA